MSVEETIWKRLESVMDPEIPSISIVEMGIVDEVTVEHGKVRVTMIPTFSGCPAIDVMKADIAAAVRDAGHEAEVIVLLKPWSTDRMADTAREKMKKIGVQPPKRHGGNVEWELFSPVPCPYCESTETAVENEFGPTLCRSIYYCNSCMQPFEKFKPL